MKFTEDYSRLVSSVLYDGYEYPDPNRTGIIRKEIFPAVITHDMADSFPLLASKKMHTRGIFLELKWMLLGRTDLNYLRDSGLKVWDKDAYNFAVKNKFKGSFDEFINEVDAGQVFSLGPMYGKQWRNCGGVDQLLNVINNLLNPHKKYSSSLIINSWNVNELHKMALPPCHHEIQFNCRPNNNGGLDLLDLQFSMRSSDVILGLPWNIAFYAMLQVLIAKITDMEPGKLTYFGKKVHIYDNQYDAAKETIIRTASPSFKDLMSEPTVDVTIQDDLLLDEYDTQSLTVLINSLNLDSIKFTDYKTPGALNSQPEMLAYS